MVSHDHEHSPVRSGRPEHWRLLAITLVLQAAYMVAEVIGGWLTGSLALMADAGHMLSDVAALALALFAMWMAGRPARPQQTFGYYRTEILAALANGASLVAISLLIFVEAVKRLGSPPEVQGAGMLAIATGGLLVNLAGLRLLEAGKGESLNVRGAWLHVLTDALGSIGAMAAAGMVWAFDWRLADPIVSMLIGLLIVYSSWELVKASVSVLMESAPGHIDVDAVRDAISECQGVLEVHDLHVWTVTSGFEALSAHVVAQQGVSHPALLGSLGRTLRSRFAIHHTTIQIEPGPGDEAAPGEPGRTPEEALECGAESCERPGR